VITQNITYSFTETSWGASVAEWLRSLTWDHWSLTAVGSILTRVEIIHVRKPSSWLTEGRWFYPGAYLLVPEIMPAGTLRSSSTNKAGKNRRKNLGGRSRMARRECTVAHMGFPAATLNKRIKKQITQSAEEFTWTRLFYVTEASIHT
jgi:hypothetical protein